MGLMELTIIFMIACLLSVFILWWGMDKANTIYPPSTPLDVLERKDNA